MIFKFLKGIFGQQNDDALKMALQRNPVLVDVRSRAEFAAGSVAGAVNFPLTELSKGAIMWSKNQPLVLFCRSGSRSAQGVAILEQLNFKEIINAGPIQNVQRVKHKLKS